MLLLRCVLSDVSDPDLYPYIDVCPFPSYHQQNLNINGYDNSYDYTKVKIV